MNQKESWPQCRFCRATVQPRWYWMTGSHIHCPECGQRLRLLLGTVENSSHETPSLLLFMSFIAVHVALMETLRNGNLTWIFVGDAVWVSISWGLYRWWYGEWPDSKREVIWRLTVPRSKPRPVIDRHGWILLFFISLSVLFVWLLDHFCHYTQSSY